MTTRWGRLLLGGLLGCLGVAALVVGVVLFQNYRKANAGAAPAATVTPTAPAPRPARVGPDTLEIPPEVVRSLDVRTAPAVAPSRPRPLPPFSGILNLDNDRLARVHTRFAGEVMALGTPAGGETTELPDAASSAARPLAVGDTVRKGQLLAVVWSKDLGEKKSELVDAVCKLKYDRINLERLRELYRQAAGTERGIRDAESAVQSDLIAVAKADRTLRSWRLTDAEIAAVRAEADRLGTLTQPRSPDDHDDPAWARVEVRAPQDGVILEKNVTFGDVVDTTADLYKIADRTRLVVWAHVYEEDLPRLQDPKLPKPLPWKVRVPSQPDAVYPGHLERIGDLIDPNQHTALVVGHVENPHGALKVGQFVTVTIELPPAADEVEVPATAVVEDGRESVVFVQPDPDLLRFERRRVTVLRRFHDVVYLSAQAADTQSPPVRVGDRVVTGGSVFLKDALADLPAGGRK
jgi:cobalt-zinc-cadmium efflux system membrane fusion protein